MRELFKALSELETRLMEQYGVSLNEAMALCCIGGDTLTASVISENTGLSASHTSKVIRSIEEKELIVRNLGDKDKRQMHFTLSDKGRECLEALKANEIEIPELLKPLFNKPFSFPFVYSGYETGEMEKQVEGVEQSAQMANMETEAD